MADPSATGAKKPLTKTEISQALADGTGLTKQQVNQLLDELTRLIGQSLGPNGAGSFTLPGLLKIVSRSKPAQPERMGKDPFTGQEKLFKAKPESRTVKVTALKGLKDMLSTPS
jgi:nucleoid DNA-binding protein